MYLIGLVNFVIVKYFGNIQIVIDRVTSNKALKAEGYWNLQLIPFTTITSSIDSYIRVGIVPSSLNFIANIVVFIPMGYLIPHVVRRPSFLKTVVYSLASILSIEIIQFLTYLGAADIDDVLLNLVGCVMGYAVYVIFRAFLNKQNKGYRTLNSRGTLPK